MEILPRKKRIEEAENLEENNKNNSVIIEKLRIAVEKLNLEKLTLVLNMKQPLIKVNQTERCINITHVRCSLLNIIKYTLIIHSLQYVRMI